MPAIGRKMGVEIRSTDEEVAIEHMTNNCNQFACAGEPLCSHVNKLVAFVELDGGASS